MNVYASLGSAHGQTDLRWKTVEVAFSNGAVVNAVAEHGLAAIVRSDGSAVAVGDLGGSGRTYASGLAFKVTFAPETDMSAVEIDFSSSVTSIISDDPLQQPTVRGSQLRSSSPPPPPLALKPGVVTPPLTSTMTIVGLDTQIQTATSEALSQAHHLPPELSDDDTSGSIVGGGSSSLAASFVFAAGTCALLLILVVWALRRRSSRRRQQHKLVLATLSHAITNTDAIDKSRSAILPTTGSLPALKQYI